MAPPSKTVSDGTSAFQVSGLLILGAFFSTFLVDSSQTLGQWIGCFPEACQNKGDAAVFKSQVAGMAIGGFLAVGLASAALARGAVTLGEGMGAAIGVLAGGLFSILELSVADRFYPEPHRVQTELYIWSVIAVLMIGPIIAKGSTASARNISLIYGRMVCTGLIGLLFAWGCVGILNLLRSGLGLSGDDYLLRPYSAITLPAMWAIMLAMPWMTGSRRGWTPTGRFQWITTMSCLTLVLAGGYGLTQSIQTKTGIDTDQIGVAASVVLLVPLVALCFAGVLLRHSSKFRFWPFHVLASGLIAGGLAYFLVHAVLEWDQMASIGYALSHALSAAIAVLLSVWIEDLILVMTRWVPRFARRTRPPTPR